MGLGSVSGARRRTHRAYLPLDAGHSVRVIVVQVGVHVIDNDHRHDGLAAHALKEKLPKGARSRCVPSGPLPREPQRERAYRLVLDSIPKLGPINYFPITVRSRSHKLGRVDARQQRCYVVHLCVDYRLTTDMLPSAWKASTIASTTSTPCGHAITR